MNKPLLGRVQKFWGSTLHNIKSLCVLGLCPCPNLPKPHILGVFFFFPFLAWPPFPGRADYLFSVSSGGN